MTMLSQVSVSMVLLSRVMMLTLIVGLPVSDQVGNEGSRRW